jgi:flagellar export protein FliJ
MRGLEALLRIRRIDEEKALEALAGARRERDRIAVEERALRARFAAIKDSLRAVEEKSFGVRESLAHRRYLNAVRGRIERCRERARGATKALEEKRAVYERKRHDREAVDELIKRRKDRAAQERARRDERAFAELGQRAWMGREG